MTQQPKLTNFPTVIFATSKRRSQVEIQRHRSALLSRSLGGYSGLFEPILPAGWLAQMDPTLRQRSFGAIPVFWAWLAQLLEQNASCAKATTMIQTWYGEIDLPRPTGGTSGYCQARMRLPLVLITRIHRRVFDQLSARTREKDRWKGFRLKAIDGTSFLLMDTEKNQSEYPQPSAQIPGCEFPVMGITGLLDLSSGAWQTIQPSNFRQSDSKAAFGVLEHLGQGDLRLGDRAYCGYALIASTLVTGAHMVARLNGARHGKLDWRRGRRVSRFARIVTWQRGQYQKSSVMTREQWEALPDTLTLRLIKMKFADRMGKVRDMVVATTLLDSSRYSDTDVFELYARRWEIEVRFRDVKTTMGLEFLAVRSPEMARKSLWMLVIAYNLIRAVMQEAARTTESDLGRMSFKATLDLVIAVRNRFQQGFRSHSHPQKDRDELIQLCLEKQLQIRPHRHEPRATKRRPKPHTYLTDHRGVFQELPHRERHRIVQKLLVRNT